LAAYVACITAVCNDDAGEDFKVEVFDEASEYVCKDGTTGDELEVAKEGADELLHWLRWLSDHEADFTTWILAM
jgi:hypothetical protein